MGEIIRIYFIKYGVFSNSSLINSCSTNKKKSLPAYKWVIRIESIRQMSRIGTGWIE